jgi:hypothetical protein
MKNNELYHPSAILIQMFVILTSIIIMEIIQDYYNKH